MAGKEKLDLGEEKPKSSSKGLIFMVSGVGFAVLIAVFATLHFLGRLPFEVNNDAEHARKGENVTESAEQKPVIYLPLSPPFSANFKDGSEARLVQIELTVAATDQRVIDAVKKHAPMLRNNILMILGGDDPARLKTAAGKEALRKKIKDEIRKVVAGQTDVKRGVDEIFFTGFVMQ